VKVEELRELDAEELSGRLKGARRELYELRFKMAVGQLDNPRQIGVVRKDIARILTIVHERRLDEEVAQAYGSAAPIIEERPVKAAAEETPEQVDTQAADTEPAAPAAEQAEASEAGAGAPAVAVAEAEAESEAKPAKTRKTTKSAEQDKESDK
jgi:large subunit ribosomal protein L29